ncbi:MAG: hypothetical protein M3071_17605 [Actinomycetota bacterium]|nr:hypothetical protein [Actinomycetota bacterium]
MRSRGLLCAIGLALTIAGCGGSGSGASGDKSAAGVRATMRVYLEDLKDNRGVDACDLMTVAARTTEGRGNPAACAAHILLVRSFLGPKGIATLEGKIAQLPITVAGNHATAPPLTGSGSSANFLYSGGHWLIGK